jgi:hypothetical protein
MAIVDEEELGDRQPTDGSPISSGPPEEQRRPPTEDALTPLQVPAPVLGPHQDPVFPSLPARTLDESPLVSDRLPPKSAIPLAHNVYTLTPITPDAVSRAREAAEEQHSPDDYGRLDAFDQAEKDRVFGIATEFIENHVRRISSGYAIRTAHEGFGAGTVVVSEKQVPRTKLRHAQLDWAITNGRVYSLQGARLPVGHLSPITPKDEPSYGSPHHGDDSDLAFLLAFVCHLLDFDSPTSIAASGTITFHTNDSLWIHDIPDLLDAARVGGVENVVLPHSVEKMEGDGRHGVHYWLIRDTNEAIFSLLTASAGEILVPNLTKRALTKQAYAWLSLVLILLAVLAFQLVASLSAGGEPPVVFVRYLLVVIAVLFIGSLIFTHRFWKIDR